MRRAACCSAFLALALTLAGGSAAGSQAPLPVLARSALSGLAASTQAVTAAELASDLAGGSAFERQLAAWGFVRGRERIFQGESQRIDRAVSRTLEFRAGAGARAYVRGLAARAAALYGAGSIASPLVSRGRSGYLFDAASCACHRAAPTLLALLANGTRVTWLELNGGGVDRAVLTRLVALAP